jgi:hypothetical protein
VPMMALLCVGMWLWLKADPTHQLFRDEPRAMPHAVPAV